MGISKNMNVHVEQVSGSTLRCLVLFFWYCFVPTGVTCKERAVVYWEPRRRAVEMQTGVYGQ
jgi:hypothetical protein